MRRIALVCDWYDPRRGGIETHLSGLASRLAARGHAVHVITSTPGPSGSDGISVHRLDVARLPFFDVAVSPVVSQIQELFVRGRIDTVHSHVSIVAPVGLGGGLAAERAGLPSVVTFHSFVPATPLLAGAAGRVLGAATWRAAMTAVSVRVAREVRAFAPRHDFSILPNAIDCEFWSPARRAESDAIHFVYAGRLRAKKRPHLLLRVMAALKQAVPEAPWRLTIVGEGPYEASIRRGAKELGIMDRVTFAGWATPEGLRDILRSADVFLNTATRESFGIAALEARSVGVPVIARRDSAVADFITDEESGLLVGDDGAFEDAAVRLVRDTGLRRRMAGHNQTTRVSWDWENSLRLHEAAYGRADALRANG